MRTGPLLLLSMLMVTSTHSFASESSIRFDYSDDNVPLHLIFSSIVSSYADLSNDELTSAENIEHQLGGVYTGLNLEQNDAGAWYMPRPANRKFDREYAQEFLNLLIDLKQESEERNRRVMEVVACPIDRLRPRDDDVYVVFEILVDAKYGIWEELRQRVARGPYAEGMERLLQRPPAISSTSYRYEKLYEGSDHDPNLHLDRVCTEFRS